MISVNFELTNIAFNRSFVHLHCQLIFFIPLFDYIILIINLFRVNFCTTMPILNSANLSLKTSVSSISRITVKTLTMTGASICVRVIWFIVEHITYMRKVFILLNCLILWFFIFLLIFFPTAVRTIFVSSCNRIHRTSIFVISSENTLTIYLLVLELTLRILKT